jgi:hypothetical protein
MSRKPSGRKWWWKHAKYEIKDGCITPVPGARLDFYDPAERYRRDRAVGAKTAFERLLDLIGRANRAAGLIGDCRHAIYETNDGECTQFTLRRGVALEPIMERRLENGVLKDLLVWEGVPPHLSTLRQLPLYSANLVEEVTDWCQDYGLLGVLPHRLERVQFAPTFSKESGGTVSVAHAASYSLAGGKWISHNMQVPIRRGPSRPGDVVPNERLLHDSKPMVILRDLDSGIGPQTGSLSLNWHKFFPPSFMGSEAIRDGKFPVPDAEIFRDNYREPLTEFLRYAVAVTSAVESLELVRNRGGEFDGDAQHLSAEEVNTALGGLLDPIGLRVSLSASLQIEESLVFPSLLSSIARLAVQDLHSGYRLRLCESCHSQFMSVAYQVKYCSETCHWREAKRRQREKKSGHKPGASHNAEETR